MMYYKKLPNRLLRYVSYVFLISLFFACSDKSEDDTPTPQEHQYLVSADLVGELSKEQLVQSSNQVSPLLGPLLKYGVKMYRLTYKTKNVDGTDIVASGAVVLPNTNKEQFSVISVQHGTIIEDELAPSNFSDKSEVKMFGTVFSSIGYITVFPDYIGYGSSKNFPHPYEHRASLASASLDMLRATKEFLADHKSTFKWNDKLLLAGYSEGGYATLSLQKKIEEEASKEFKLVASAPGAGAYNKTAFMNHIVNNPTHGVANFNKSYVWVLLAYNQIYGLNKPISYYFKEPYALDIKESGLMVNMNVSFHTTLQDSFKEELKSSANSVFKTAVADNDLINWKPVTPTRLIHGTADEMVFFFNSETAYEGMKAKGSTSVELVKLEGKNHSTAILDYLLNTYEFFYSK